MSQWPPSPHRSCPSTASTCRPTTRWSQAAPWMTSKSSLLGGLIVEHESEVAQSCHRCHPSHAPPRRSPALVDAGAGPDRGAARLRAGAGSRCVRRGAFAEPASSNRPTRDRGGRRAHTRSTAASRRGSTQPPASRSTGWLTSQAQRWKSTPTPARTATAAVRSTGAHKALICQARSRALPISTSKPFSTASTAEFTTLSHDGLDSVTGITAYWGNISP